MPGLSLEAICTARGANAETLAKRYGMRLATTDSSRLMADPEINAIAVLTRHDSHARLTLEGLAAGKNVYVEKPLALTSEELEPITSLLARRVPGGPTLWVGYNRRYSPLSQKALSHFGGIDVRQVTCTVRSAGVPADSWYQDPAEGGGILFGDVCHFIDLAIYLAQSPPVEVHALATSDPAHREDSWAISMRCTNGGLATVNYVCGSNQGLDRETIDLLGGGRSARIAGFKKLTLRGGGAGAQNLQPDLGQKPMLERMVAQFARQGGVRDETDGFILSTQALLAAHRSIVESRVVTLEPRFPYTPD